MAKVKALLDGNKLTLEIELEQPVMSKSGKMYIASSSRGWIEFAEHGLTPNNPLCMNYNLGFFLNRTEDAKKELPYIREITQIAQDDEAEKS